MQIEIDFEVFKALTAMREAEGDSYNDVIRRVLKLPSPADGSLPMNALAPSWRNRAAFDVAYAQPQRNALAMLGGTWFNGVHFPEGTQFRATYKGATYQAAIKNGRWIGEDGVSRNSPSDAASAITHTNVNGWRFWFALLPDSGNWRRLDEFKP